MRQAIIPLILAALTGCATTTGSEDTYSKANSVVAAEIGRRIEDIRYLHRQDLLDNLMWLAQAGEQAIPYLVKGLRHEDAKVRANSAWVLGRIKDRRVIPDLQMAASDENPTVRLEIARTLVTLGDLKHAPVLIEGLDSDRPAVRYNCHQALKDATNRDFGYDHLAENVGERQRAVLRWRQWWGEQFNDRWFAQSYAQAHGFGNGAEMPTAAPPMPMTEPNTPAIRPQTPDQTQPGTAPEGGQAGKPDGSMPPAEAGPESGAPAPERPSAGQVRTPSPESAPSTTDMPAPRPRPDGGR
jgi:hypothetical protein